jgi:hypothetical protein
MSAFRICVLWVLLFPLLGIRACTADHQTGLSINCNASTHTCTVQIDPGNLSCIATGQNPQDVPLGYQLIWASPPPTSPPHVYSANFWSSKVPFPPNPSGPVTTVNAGMGVTVTGDSECSSSTTIGCYFPYVILKDGMKACSDPGIHVDPNGIFNKQSDTTKSR